MIHWPKRVSLESLGMRSDVSLMVFAFAVLLVGAPVDGRADEQAINSANGLMQKRMFRDAIRALGAAIAKQTDPDSGRELRMIAESHYMLKEYGAARTYFLRALPHQTTSSGRIICESRLAILDYRLGDLNGAEERIAEFIRLNPNDERVGPLTVIRIRAFQDSRLPVAEKIQKIEAEYARLAGNKERFGYYNYVLAAQILGEVYISAESDQKAIALYVKAAHEMRSLIAKMLAEGKPVPKDLSHGVDGMSLHIAKHLLSRKDYAEAQKWLENVTHDAGTDVAADDEMKAQAKYLLAQINYQKGEYGEVLFHLQDSLILKTPDGDTKWGMCMLAGFAWRDGKTPDLEKAKELLKQIPPTYTGYAQAQHGLGDIYRGQKDPDRAEAHYRESAKSPKYAAAALFYLAEINKNRADAMKPRNDAETTARDTSYRKAGGYVQELLLKYPQSDLAKDAKVMATALQALGIAIEVDASEDEKVATWKKVVTDKPGTDDAAQALINLAQQYGRTITDPRTKSVTKAPDWKAVAEVCMPIIKSPQPFTGVSGERWKEMQAQANFFLGRAELGSLMPSAGTRQLERKPVDPVRMDGGGSTVRALEYLRQAQRLTPEKHPAYREIDFAITEAMLKSEDNAIREGGERRYAELEPKYGADPNYQRLAIITADWLGDHGQHETAGRTYRTIARRANLDREQVMQLLYMSGLSYGKAGRAMLDSGKEKTSLAFLVQPRGVIRSNVSIFRSHPPLQSVKRMLWEQQGPDLSAADALARISKEFNVPFVWNPSADSGSVAAYLKSTIIPRATLVSWRGPRTLGEYYASVVGTNRFILDFDLGVSGGTPTIAVKAGESDTVKVLEIYDPARSRFPSLAKPYGSFASVHSKGAMLFTIIKRVEELTGAKVVWGDGVQKDDALSREFRELPGIPSGANAACTEVLRAALEPAGLGYEVVRRDSSRELLQESNDSFDELRRFGSDARYAEDAMFNIAVNLYVMKDYSKMKLLLREYLKTYDNPTFAHYYDACFWLGRLFEIDRNYREAVKYYIMASEERVVLYRPEAGRAAPGLDEVKSRLSYETLFNLSRKGSGSFAGIKLEGEGGFFSFIRFNTNVELGLDSSARGSESVITRESFMAVPCINLLYDAMIELGLDLRTQNGDPEVAEKAYHRLALVYKEDNLMREALEYVNTMLTRFPRSPRRLDVLKLKLDIYKGLRDYANALTTLEEIKQSAQGRIEEYLLDYETGRIYFDLCDYGSAEKALTRSLSGAKDPQESLKIREALAITYVRMTNRWDDALSAYREIAQQETERGRQSIDGLMIWFLECVTARPPARRPMPEKEKTFIDAYAGLSDKQRGEMDASEIARATWVYYTAALVDLHVGGNRMEALDKFNAAAGSPDEFLGGEALYEIGMIHLANSDFAQARSTFEHLLFITKSVEPTVKATYALAQCLKALNESEGALRRLDEIVSRYPVSPYAALAKEDPLYKRKSAGGAAQPAATKSTASGVRP